jgi:hypothetical protein
MSRRTFSDIAPPDPGDQAPAEAPAPPAGPAPAPAPAGTPGPAPARAVSRRSGRQSASPPGQTLASESGRPDSSADGRASARTPGRAPARTRARVDATPAESPAASTWRRVVEVEARRYAAAAARLAERGSDLDAAVTAATGAGIAPGDVATWLDASGATSGPYPANSPG